jgi:16S rRNA (guanine966-N2)-methyltransferase
MKTPRDKPSSRRDAPPTGEVRIVGGRWRGSKLPVADRVGLRPTADRVRETVFNWLQPVLPGARVLDLFAGSGALGLEALSRGAHAATLIERDRDLAASLHATFERLRRGDPADLDCSADVVQADALGWLAAPPADPNRRYDLIFLDPPFASGLWRPVLDALPPWLADDAWLYLEAPGGIDVAGGANIELGADWRLHREGATRDVRYALYRRSG